MIFLRQSTAATLRVGPFLDETDGKTAETALTISQADVKLSKAHAAFAQKNDATSCTHDQAGWYSCPLNATDTATAGAMILAVHESGALPVWHEFVVLPQAIFDWFVAGSAVETTMSAIKAKTDLIPASPAAIGSAMTLTGGERDSVADALLDRADAIETGVTFRKALRGFVAALLGKSSNDGNTFRNIGDTKNVITATVDADNNRTAVTRDLT